MAGRSPRGCGGRRVHAHTHELPHTPQRCALQFSFPTLGSVELLANVALLLPVIFFATLATGRPGLTMLAGTALSAAIEGVQALVPAIGRSCDTNDWAMNTLGALVAAVLGWAVLKLDREPETRPAAPAR